MNSKTIRWVFGLGLAAIIGILCFQVYWVMMNYQSKQEAIEQKISIVLYETAEGLAKYNHSVLPRENLITRRSSNYYIVNINDVIDANIIEHYMLEGMKRIGLDMDFEYGIYDCEKDQMVYGHYCDIDMVSKNDESVILPKYDKFDYYFGVRFPSLRNAILDDMSMTLIMAGLLFITLLFFGVALYIIINQKRLSDLQRDFINNMTHELKTPLSSIKIAGETFLTSSFVEADPRLLKYAQIIRDQSTRLNLHVEKILDVARLEGDLVKLNKETFDLVGVLEGVAHEYQARAASLGGKLEFDCSIKQAFVFGDPLHLANVFHNLIDNALKYGGVPPEVFIKVNSTSELIEMSFKDNGNGISKKNQSKIFDKFYRVPTGDIHNIKGFGLGLYYVQQIVKLHKWNLSVNSDLGSSTEFVLKAPIK